MFFPYICMAHECEGMYCFYLGEKCKAMFFTQNKYHTSPTYYPKHALSVFL